MTDSAMGPFEMILRQCAAASPEPWYPKSFAAATGIDRNSLDPYLERLRMAGLVRLTDWVQGHGQGYVLTSDGSRVLNSPRELARVEAGQLPAAREEPEEAAPKPSGMTTYERGELIRESLLNPPPPRVTHMLLAANFAVFLLGAALAQQDKVLNDYLAGNRDSFSVLVRIGALRNIDVAEGQWWRLLTCCFVHIGALHLLMNMLGLWMIGPMLERMFGRWRYLLIYLISGLGGSVAMCVSLVTAWQAPGAGASGAIWGLLTAMVAWIILNRDVLGRDIASRWLSQLGTVLLLNVFISFLPGISAAGHFGGGAVGFIVAYLLNYQRFGRSALLRLFALAVVLFTPAGLVASLPHAEKAYLRWLARTPAGLQRVEAREAFEMEEKHLPVVQKLEREAQEALDRKAKEVLAQNWQRREGAAVEKAVTDLTDSIAKLRQAIEIMSRVGPYLAPDIEKARLTRKEYLEAQLAYDELALRCLKEGEKWTGKDEEAIAEQTKKVWDSRDRWKRMLQ